MNIVYNSIFLQHETGSHPENSSRFKYFKKLTDNQIQSGENYLPLVHSHPYINSVLNMSKTGGGIINSETIISAKTYDAACIAVGAAIQASESNDFALVRPPGHHAYTDHGAGFCIFNSLAIAVQKLVTEGKRVAIIDIDGHLGDGTENFFYKTNKVLYTSLHQYPAYPGGGSVDDIGADNGKGFTINIPLESGSSDDIYIKGLNLILTVLDQYRPDYIAVSAGFDAHQLDQLLQLKLSAGIYFTIGKLLISKSVPLFAVLEGGYNPFILEKCVMNFINGVNGKEIYFQDEVRESTILAMESFNAQIDLLTKNLAPYWKL